MIVKVNPPRQIMQALANVTSGELQRRGLADAEQVARLRAMRPDDALEAFFETAGCPAFRLNTGEGRYLEIRPGVVVLGFPL